MVSFHLIWKFCCFSRSVRKSALLNYFWMVWIFILAGISLPWWQMFIPISPKHSMLLHVHEICHLMVTWYWFKVFENRLFSVVFVPFVQGFASVALYFLCCKVARILSTYINPEPSGWWNKSHICTVGVKWTLITVSIVWQWTSTHILRRHPVGLWRSCNQPKESAYMFVSKIMRELLDIECLSIQQR